jgi:hypothetical protein
MSKSTSNSSDGWTTVRRTPAAAAAPAAGGGGSGGYRRWGDRDESSRGEMPSAFGGGNRERQNARREEEARRAWDERRAAVEKERAAKAEAERQAKLRDFTDTDQYPALGGGRGAAPKPKAAAAPMNFRDMARETAARSALEEADAIAAAKRRELEASRRIYANGAGGAGGPRLYRHGSYDDGPVDHSYPDEEGYYPPDDEGDYMAAAPEGGGYPDADEEAAEADAEAEFNSHLAVLRRRGDKSDW